MSDPGHGTPVDGLDSVCRDYKNCLKCARMTYGETCLAEFHKYRYDQTQDEVTCQDDPNSCKRAICECDAMFAKQHDIHSGFFNDQYQMQFSGTGGWDPESQCVRIGMVTYFEKLLWLIIIIIRIKL